MIFEMRDQECFFHSEIRNISGAILKAGKNFEHFMTQAGLRYILLPAC